MKKQTLLIAIICASAAAATAQNQADDYRRLSEASKSAFSGSGVTYTLKRIDNYTSSGTFGSTTSGSSSSRTSSTISPGITSSGGGASYVPNLNSRQQAAIARIKAANDEWNGKMKEMNRLIARRNIPRDGAYYNDFIKAATDAGFSQVEAVRLWGGSAAELSAGFAAEKRSAFGFKGSTKDDCQGGCSETLTDKLGNTYVGNTKGGLPNGQGTYTYPEFNVTGTFVDGSPKGDGVVHFNSGDRYEGGLDGIGYDGRGRYTYANGDYVEGGYKNSELFDGPYKTVMGKFNETGEMDNGKYIKQRMINYADGTKLLHNYDDPKNSAVLFADGDSFVGKLTDDNNMYRGSLTNPQTVRFGEYTNNGALKFGSITFKNIADTMYVNFAPAAGIPAYRLEKLSGGRMTEQLRDPKTGKILAETIFYGNGERFTGIYNAIPGQLMTGILTLKNQKSYCACRKDEQSGPDFIEDTTSPLYQKALADGKKAIADIERGRDEFNRLWDGLLEEWNK
ncbi:MAG TPA: hypothetical protein VHA56_14630 [Mucilaginibacter sp.]|nr:hypothetical protein [Mucilaginibacter sp.]